MTTEGTSLKHWGKIDTYTYVKDHGEGTSGRGRESRGSDNPRCVRRERVTVRSKSEEKFRPLTCCDPTTGLQLLPSSLHLDPGTSGSHSGPWDRLTRGGMSHRPKDRVVSDRVKSVPCKPLNSQLRSSLRVVHLEDPGPPPIVLLRQTLGGRSTLGT